MNYYNGFGHMSYGGSGFFCALISIVVFVDLVLIGIWLWKRIERESKCCGDHHGHHDHEHEHDHDHPHDHNH